ncbi:MAG: CoA pyrophosphatase [Clostridium perfringens]|nr:CoA pyrophosphatase [Clostridium perfringens]
MYTENIIDNIFKEYKPYINGANDFKRAAIILPLIKRGDKFNILFELRTDKLTTNPGEVCFPGGSIEKGETPLEAALRECYEEVGTRNEQVKVVSPLDIFISNNNILIHPFLAYIDESAKFTLSEDEVKEVFEVPLEDLLNTEQISVNNNVVIEHGENFPYEFVKNDKNHKFKTGVYRTVFYKYENYFIWGITGRILENFLDFIKTHENALK